MNPAQSCSSTSCAIAWTSSWWRLADRAYLSQAHLWLLLCRTPPISTTATRTDTRSASATTSSLRTNRSIWGTVSVINSLQAPSCRRTKDKAYETLVRTLRLPVFSTSNSWSQIGTCRKRSTTKMQLAGTLTTAADTQRWAYRITITHWHLTTTLQIFSHRGAPSVSMEAASLVTLLRVKLRAYSITRRFPQVWTFLSSLSLVEGQM